MVLMARPSTSQRAVSRATGGGGMSLGVAWVLSVRVGRVRIVWLGYTIGGGAACLTWITPWVKDI
jgi:hypothetical protein